MIRSFVDRFPLVAILRGITPDAAVPVGRALVAHGFTVVEVPLNSPEPFESIRRLADALGPEVLVGAGTVTALDQIAPLQAAGGRLVVMPHSDPAVIRAAKAAGMACAPGVATPTEAFAALGNGADVLKMFPAEAMPPAVLKAWRSVFPPGTALLPVGGITPEGMGPYVEAGAAGFGLGSALYRPGADAQAVAERAAAFAAAWGRLKGG